MKVIVEDMATFTYIRGFPSSAKSYSTYLRYSCVAKLVRLRQKWLDLLSSLYVVKYSKHDMKSLLVLDHMDTRTPFCKMSSRGRFVWKSLTTTSIISIDGAVSHQIWSTASASRCLRTWTRWGLCSIPGFRKIAPRWNIFWTFSFWRKLDVQRLFVPIREAFSTQVWFCPRNAVFLGRYIPRRSDCGRKMAFNHMNNCLFLTEK